MLTYQRVHAVAVCLLVATAATAAEPVVLKGHTDLIFSIEWSPNGKMLASCGMDNTVRVWDVTEKKEIALFRGGKARFHGGPGQTSGVRWNANGTLVAFGGSDWKVRVCEIKTGKERTVFDAAGKGVAAFDWHPDGRRIASAVGEAFDQETKESFDLWDADTGKVTRSWKPTEVAHTKFVRWNPNGTRVAFGDQFGWVTVHDPDADKPVATFKAQDIALESMVWSPDGKNLATGGLDRQPRNKKDSRYTAKVWDAATGKLTRTFPVGLLAEDIVVEWSPDGKTLAVRDSNWIVAIWNPFTGRRLWQFNDGFSVNWRPDGTSLLIRTIGRTLLVDAKTGRSLWEQVDSEETPPMVRKLRWRPDGLAVAGINTGFFELVAPFSILVWDFPKLKK